MLGLAVVLLALACPPRDGPAWHWRDHVRRADGSEVTRPGIETRPVLLVFSSAWATPCEPLLSELAGLSDRAQVLVVQADPAAPAVAGDSFGFEVLVPTGPELIRRMDVRVLPTGVLFDRSGSQVGRFEGYSTKQAARVSAALDSVVATEKQ